MSKPINLFALYEDLKKYQDEDRDDLFYDAPEGSAQIDILIEMLQEITTAIKKD